MSNLLGSFVSSAIKVVSDPGEVAKGLVDAVLPKNLAFVGDAIGAAIDLEVPGYESKALRHELDTVRDLPQALGSGAKGGAGASPATTLKNGSPQFAPTPPPVRTPVTPTPSSSATAAKPTAWHHGTAPNGWRGNPSSTTPVAGGSSGATHANLDLSLKALLSALLKALQPSSTTAASTSKTPSAPSASPPAAPSTDATPATTKTASADATPAATKTPSTDATPAATKTASVDATSGATSTASSTASKTASGASGAPQSLSDLLGLSDAEFMKAMTSGALPADVKNDPNAMVQIQARMNQISQMTELLSTMMKSMHDMQMAVIQNVRV